jgi:hypothetical protein
MALWHVYVGANTYIVVVFTKGDYDLVIVDGGESEASGDGEAQRGCKNSVGAHVWRLVAQVS